MSTRIIVNFHAVDWRNADSVLVYLVGSLLGHDMTYVHVSLTVTSGDKAYNIDYSRWGLQLPATEELKNVKARVVIHPVTDPLFDLVTGRLVTALTMRLKLSIPDLILAGLRIEPSGFICTTFIQYLLGFTDHKKPATPIELYRQLIAQCQISQNDSYATKRAKNVGAGITGPSFTMND
jgi:hypothetical protein